MRKEYYVARSPKKKIMTVIYILDLTTESGRGQLQKFEKEKGLISADLSGVINPSPPQYVCRTYAEGANRVDKLQQNKKNEIDVSKITVSHKMIDGTLKNTIENYEIPYNEVTAIVYSLISANVQSHEN